MDRAVWHAVALSGCVDISVRSNTTLCLLLITESTWRHHMEVDSEYIYVDLMDTAGEVRKKKNFQKLIFMNKYSLAWWESQMGKYLIRRHGTRTKHSQVRAPWPGAK